MLFLGVLTFMATCSPANYGKKHANVSALELSDYFDVDNNNSQDEAETSAAMTSTRGQRRGRGNRGSGRGVRGRGGRNTRQPFRPPIQSTDVQDGGFNNYKQTPEGKVILSPQGHPLCNYCGTPSHKREICGVKKADRAAGLNRTLHPDRDMPRTKPAKSPVVKAKASEVVISAATPMAQVPQYTPSYPVVPWNYPVAMKQQPMDTWQQQMHKGQILQPMVHTTRMEHDQGVPSLMTYGTQNVQQTPKSAAANVTDANPCPYPNFQAMLTNQHVTQEHFRTFHGQTNNLAMMPGNPLLCYQSKPRLYARSTGTQSTGTIIGSNHMC